jgi:hypothetical protein
LTMEGQGGDFLVLQVHQTIERGDGDDIGVLQAADQAGLVQRIPLRAPTWGHRTSQLRVMAAIDRALITGPQPVPDLETSDGRHIVR